MPQLFEHSSLTQQHCLARALYDNSPDSPDELEFRKGDTLVVLEQNTANIEGWWLCALRGRQGICPANRLRLIPGLYEENTGPRTCHQFTEIMGDFSGLQRQGKRRSWHVQSNQVVTPKRFNDVYLYDMLPSRVSPIQVTPSATQGLNSREQAVDCYDVPPKAIPINNDGSASCHSCSPAPSCVSPVSIRDSGDTYDIPRPLKNRANQLTPSSSASSLTADSLSSSNRSSLMNMPDYDVPKPAVRIHPVLLHHPTNISELNVTFKELPLELSSALETLEKLETDATSAISKLLSFVGPQWRTKEKLENNLMDIKLYVTRLQTSLHDLAEFSEGTLGNATRASDKNLALKLAPLVTALKKSNILVQEASEKLKQHGWSIDILSKAYDEDKTVKPDELDQLVACTRALIEDIRQIASFIQGNGLLLFRREPNINNNETREDYDFIHLNSKEIRKKEMQIENALPKEQKDCDMVDSERSSLDDDDKSLLLFFAAQVITHHTNLTQAIDAFLLTVEQNQPPKTFLAHGKFVVLSAHKLVHIGDTVQRNISSMDIKERSLNYSNAIADTLVTCVNKTKQAALQFPSVTAVQEMVDSIVDISYAARDLKLCIVQAASNVQCHKENHKSCM